VGLIALVINAILKVFYPNSPKKLRIEASLILAFLALVLVSPLSLFVIVIIELGLLYGLKKI
jgi:uncharacterized membrane protein